MKAIDKLLEFMQRHQLTSVDYATYDVRGGYMTIILSVIVNGLTF